MVSFAKVRFERNGDVLIGSLAGDVDLTNAPDVADKLMSAILSAPPSDDFWPLLGSRIPSP